MVNSLLSPFVHKMPSGSHAAKPIDIETTAVAISTHPDDTATNVNLRVTASSALPYDSSQRFKTHIIAALPRRVDKNVQALNTELSSRCTERHPSFVSSEHHVGTCRFELSVSI